MAPKKKEKNLKRSNIITLKLTNIELAVISNKIIPILLHAFFLNISVLHSYVVISDRKGNIMLQKLYVFFKKETVLSIAVILALLSMFLIRPDNVYFSYIDFRTLGLLFCLMAIVAGLKAIDVFDIFAEKYNCSFKKEDKFNADIFDININGIKI